VDDLLLVLAYLTTAVMLAVSFAILWRCRKRSRKATTLAFVALCGLGGLWLCAIAFQFLWRAWLTSGALGGDVLVVLRTYSLIQSGLNAACLVLLVLAVVADRPAAGEHWANDRGPAADFDDAPAGGPPR
jgi:hypothetical protein